MNDLHHITELCLREVVTRVVTANEKLERAIDEAHQRAVKDSFNLGVYIGLRKAQELLRG